jgi:hypothetical protein
MGNKVDFISPPLRAGLTLILFALIQCMVKLRKNSENAKRHGIEAHGYTEETFNERVGNDKENFRKLIKTS